MEALALALSCMVLTVGFAAVVVWVIAPEPVRQALRDWWGTFR